MVLLCSIDGYPASGQNNLPRAVEVQGGVRDISIVKTRSYKLQLKLSLSYNSKLQLKLSLSYNIYIYPFSAINSNSIFPFSSDYQIFRFIVKDNIAFSLNLS